MSKVLIIEDEVAIADLEKDYLELSGFEVETENDGVVGLKRALSEDFDMYILDLMLPGVDGFEICRQIRGQKNTPIIMVSAKKDDIDKIRGLGLGADDYMTKPFSPSELVARVKAHMARYERLVSTNMPKNDIVEIRGIKIDKEQCDILCDEIKRVKEGGKMADVQPEVKALCEELSGFKYEDCFAHNNVGFQDGSVTPAE